MAKNPLDRRVKRATSVLELIYTNIFRPFNEMARRAFHYFITFTDDFSRYGYVYLMKYMHKSFEKFKEFKAKVEIQTGKDVKTL
jgi:hypothetical protein